MIIATLLTFSLYVYDGDTIKLNDERYRLQGIDAPETRQLCKDETGKDYACGMEARNKLIEMIGDRPVTCQGDEVDKYGRTLGTCFSGGVNLNENMVTAGEAVAYTRYSKAYVAQEMDAKANKRGIWRGTFMQPEEWRHTHEKIEQQRN